MRTLTLAMLRPLRALLRSLQTDVDRVSAAQRFVRAALLFVPMGFVVVILRVCRVMAGPIDIDVLTREGTRLRGRLPDLVPLYLWLFGAWEPDVATFMRRRLQPGDGFIDIGAHVGTFALLAAERVGRDGAVLAVEASESTFAILNENIARNELTSVVRTAHVAVSDQRDRLTLYGGPAHNLGLTSTRQHRAMQSVGEVDAKPLEEIATDEQLGGARLIKIDVEGGEDRVLADLATLIGRLREDVEIVVELSPTWWDEPGLTPRDVLQPFLDAGFHAYEIDNNYWPWRYLWPNDTRPPRRVHRELFERENRIDLVLSRVDADVL